jgi:hypothetical protein
MVDTCNVSESEGNTPNLRRKFLCGLALSSIAGHGASNAQDEPKRPDPADFQAGDFLWPKRPGQWVPYNSGADPERTIDKARWLQERNSFIATIRAQSNSPQQLRQLATDLEGMEYSEFYELYQGDRAPDVSQPFGGGGGGGFYVGHVAIVGLQDATPIVIEALDGKNVVTSTYADWLISRPGAWVWHGRISNRSVTDRAKIFAEAAKHIGKKYDFWKLDLSDTSGFYCSKLCWLATMNSLSLAIDDNPDPKRGFWFSPKQMLKSKRIEKRFNPGNYTF